jgi:hypothetical protein
MRSPDLHSLRSACHSPKAGTALQELRLAGPCSSALHNHCSAHHTPKACTALHNIHSARLCL